MTPECVTQRHTNMGLTFRNKCTGTIHLLRLHGKFNTYSTAS